MLGRGRRRGARFSGVPRFVRTSTRLNRVGLAAPVSRKQGTRDQLRYGRVGTVTQTNGVDDKRCMRAAIDEARRAGTRGEVPIGAVVVLGGVIVGRGCNEPIERHDPTAHAEMTALRDAARAVNNYRLTGADLFVTVEPCLMCAGAIVHARIGRLVYGTPEPKAGAAHSAMQVFGEPSLNHRVTVVAGVLETECRQLIQGFFAKRRAG